LKAKYLNYEKGSSPLKNETNLQKQKEDVDFIHEHTEDYFYEDRVIDELNNHNFDRNAALDFLLKIKEKEEKQKKIQNNFKKSQKSTKQQNIVVVRKSGETETTPNKGKISKHFYFSINMSMIITHFRISSKH
jgi:hypothetical protein